MTEKMRVKDLSVELGISNKDLIQALRELGVQAKSHMSIVEDEYLEDIRGKFRDGAPVQQMERKEIQPGVIVRRRRKAPRGRDAAAEDVGAETAEAPEIDEAPEGAEPEEAPIEAAEAAPVAEPESPRPAEPAARIIRPAGAAEQEPEPAPEAEQEPEPEAQAATEESAEPGEAAESAEAPVAEVAETAADATAETAAGTAAETAADAATADAAETEAAAEEAGEPAAAKADDGEAEPAEEDGPKRKKKRKKSAEGPQVKVISRPDPSLAPAPAPEPRAPRPAGPRPGGPRPGGPGGPRPGGPRPGGPGGPGGFRSAPGTDGPAAPTGDGRGKKRKKDRRVVEFSQDTTEETRRRAMDHKRKKGSDVADSTGGKVRATRRGKKGAAQEPMLPPSASQPLKAAKRKLKVEEAIRVGDMAQQMSIKATEIIKVLMGLGVLATINQSLDLETAGVVAAEFGWGVEKVGFDEEDYIVPKEADKPEELKPRPPVVTIMGHVDHGKTSLLDAIRHSSITSGEAGGITQHIGAYHVNTDRGEIVFLDTPGHEAFTAMRARGAQVTDIVILVVAADDGVMDQTREAISHSKAAGVPIVVAVNKIDKEDADPDRVKRELGEHGLVPEDWGGDTIFANVSAKQRIGLDELLELVLLQAEVLELKANPDKPARGHIVEARLDKGRGPVATVLIQEGSLRQGDYFVCGLYSGRVRAMFDDQGKKVKSAGPAMPVEVQGFAGVPEAGDEFVMVEDEKVSRRIADSRQLKQREKTLAKESKVTLETFLSRRAGQEETQILNLIVKADVQGSIEAITESLTKLGTEQVRVNVIHGGVGAITESDILLASASEAIIIGFNVRPSVKVKEMAEQEGVDIRFYDIIYKLVSEIKDAMSGLLAPVIKEVYLGQAEVRETFSVPKVGTVAGCAVVDGKITRNCRVRLLRGGVVVYTGKITSLKRFKDDAKEVLKGYECGMGLENFNDIKIGDFIEAFEEVEEAQTL
ncbi:MAG: translation initiation factor IF-2 [Desulfovibrionaceae bacterium]|jgi:translation initiation factor IF-2|nr:translation initiation factor IF-2 [Desulfovibrionaceae bacterium]